MIYLMRLSHPKEPSPALLIFPVQTTLSFHEFQLFLDIVIQAQLLFPPKQERRNPAQEVSPAYFQTAQVNIKT